MIIVGRLEKFPMPPSVNACYVNVGNRRVASRDLKSFRTKAMAWALLNKPHLERIRRKAKEHLDENSKICLEFRFKFPAKKLYLKADKRPKKLDVSNRIKAAEDKVCDFLDFDDRYVYRVTAEKVVGSTEEFDVTIFAFD